VNGHVRRRRQRSDRRWCVDEIRLTAWSRVEPEVAHHPDDLEPRAGFLLLVVPDLAQAHADRIAADVVRKGLVDDDDRVCGADVAGLWNERPAVTGTPNASKKPGSTAAMRTSSFSMFVATTTGGSVPR
jgi:hypothetical protein